MDRLTPLIRLSVRYRWVPIVVLHSTTACISSYAAFWLRFDGNIPVAEGDLWLSTLPLLILLRGLAFIPFRLYEGLWRYTSIWDLRNIIASTLLGSVAFVLLTRSAFTASSYPRSVYLLDAILLIVALSGIRLGRR